MVRPVPRLIDPPRAKNSSTVSFIISLHFPLLDKGRVVDLSPRFLCVFLVEVDRNDATSAVYDGMSAIPATSAVLDDVDCVHVDWCFSRFVCV